MFSAGIADKLGNGYEARWLVRLLLDVVWGKAQWLRYEGIGTEFAGFECALMRDGVLEWHQTKINNTRGNWTVGRLDQERVLAAFASRLANSDTDRCLFVSNDPVKGLARLIECADRERDPAALVAHLTTPDQQDWQALKDLWAIDDTTLSA